MSQSKLPVKPERQDVSRTLIENIEDLVEYCNVRDLSETLLKEISPFGEEYVNNAYVSIERNWGHVDIAIKSSRKETDEEFAVRERAYDVALRKYHERQAGRIEKKRAELANDEAEFERLKKKLGK